MSRHSLDISVDVGWNSALQSFYIQVEPTGGEPRVWLGDKQRDIPTIQDFRRVFCDMPLAELMLDADLMGLLEDDRRDNAG